MQGSWRSISIYAVILGLAAVMILSSTLPASTRGHWMDVETIGVGASIGSEKVNITEWCLIGCCHTCGHMDVMVYSDVINVSVEGHHHCGCGELHHNHTGHGCTFWLGMIVRSTGTVPSLVSGVTVTANTTGNLNYTVYLYGPVEDPVEEGLWGCNLSPCHFPPPGNVSSVELYGGSEAAVIWVMVKSVPANSLVTITVSHSAVPLNG